MTTDPRHLPQIDALLAHDMLRDLVRRFSHDEVVRALRTHLADLRARILAGSDVDIPNPDDPGFAKALADNIASDRQPHLRHLVNATGVLIHTNLGRAPLAPQARRAIETVAAHPSNIELDLETGKRGTRDTAVSDLICRLTGAEAALVVNNCAAAVLLSLAATAQGKSVVASRGELVEIGGSFRLPDVIAQSGARLHEVGTTNKTRIADYADAIGPETAVLLKSHTSNYQIIGFTAAPKRAELAALARARDVILIEDLGSGVLTDLSAFGLGSEPVVRDVLKAGVDLVMFSGDKLLGGPQCGIIAGRTAVLDRLRKHPLLRTVRIDKLSLAALAATLRLYLPPHDPLEEIPVLRMLAEPLETLQARANAIHAHLHAEGLNDVAVVPTAARAGAGTVPQQDLPSVALSIAIPGLSAHALAERLRQAAIPVIGRVRKDRLLLDLRSIAAADLPDLRNALQALTR